ncbi:zinc finger protein pita-like [Prorops nasuta]|uniref:zinc finger protein pita-like n=1 Tax=Prorops nasuta TaxID=863751 RepID=UPI0034CEAE9D
MENRPPLRSRRVCRFCLTESEPLKFIYERDHIKNFQAPLTLQIMSCVGIEVYPADGMPQMICRSCRWNLDRSYKFKVQCKQADEALRADPSTGILPRPFPPIPTDPPDVSTNKRTAEQRSQSEQAKKPRVDNGDRERQIERDRERNRQEIKNEQRAIKSDFYEEEQDGGSEGEQEGNDSKESRKLEPGEIRVHSCDQCNRTFPLRQALLIHIHSAHRDRHHQCSECDKLFFSKYDLSKHMSTHSDDKPYTCTICQKQFSRASLLQRHEKVHMEDMRYGCQNCDREFFTSEELEKHENTAHKKEKPYQCNICNKQFSYKQGLERHEIQHNEDKSFVCEYCKEAFRTSTKLAAHLKTHAGHRPYLCKLCPRTFLLSHHLTRHMRTHSVEKNHVCEDCGKAFKRKESLEVHQLTHTKRTGLGLTCDVCQESCRNRADYVTHIKQHIEAGEKMGPDGLQPDNKAKVELDSDEEEEEGDQYSDGDDDYQPPPYIVKKLPKSKPSESDDEVEGSGDKEERKEKVVYVRGKDGNMVKKTIKTLMPIQRRDVQEKPKLTSPQTNAKPQIKSETEITKNRVDDTEAQVQKIVASVFKEHKIPLKHHNDGKDSPNTPVRQQQLKDEKSDGTPKSVSTVKVIKRIVVRKPATGSGEVSNPTKETETSPQTPGSGTKVTKRVIVRRIIRQGDTTREVIMNPDGTLIDAAELAKLPAGNVVKRVVVKKSASNLDKGQGIVQAVLRNTLKSNDLGEKVSQSPSVSSVTVNTASVPKLTKDQETKEKLEQLEKRVEQQRLKIEELQARKQQEYEAIDEMLPERHDESEDEQQLPLKRVFVKRKQSIYDEEREYHDNEMKPVTTVPTKDSNVQDRDEVDEEEEELVTKVEVEIPTEPPPRRTPIVKSTNVYANKKIIVIKAEEPSEVEQMSRELSSILDSTENVVKMQENVFNNLSQISGISECSTDKTFIETEKEPEIEEKVTVEGLEEQPAEVEVKTDETDGAEDQMKPEVVEEIAESQQEATLELDGQVLTETVDIFEPSDNVLDVQKSTDALNDSVIELDNPNDTITLNDTNDSQDSLEDKLSRMEG